MTQLVVYEHPWQLRLRIMVRYHRRKALAARNITNRRMQDAADQADRFVSTYCEKEQQRLKDVRRRIRLVSKGVPLTEVLEETELDDTPELSDAQAVILKKAYRLAASLLHPDRKHGSEEEFQALRAAYVAKDLQAVQEFVLHLEKPLEEQVQYWQDEETRVHISWQKFRQTAAYQIAHALQLKTQPHEVLVEAVKNMMVHQALMLEAQLINSMANTAAEQFNSPAPSGSF